MTLLAAVPLFALIMGIRPFRGLRKGAYAHDQRRWVVGQDQRTGLSLDDVLSHVLDQLGNGRDSSPAGLATLAR